MRCLLLSDLHLEFGDFTIPKLKGEKHVVLLLAGDISTLNEKGFCYLELFLKDCCSRFRDVVYIAGNHEHYHREYTETIETLENLHNILDDCHNLTFLENDSVSIDGVTFIGATLWTDFNDQDPNSMKNAKDFMSDYKCIKSENKIIIPHEILQKHIESRDFIFEKVIEEKKKGNKVVVLSHHLPSNLSVHTDFLTSGLTGAFVTDLESKIKDTEPNYWCHGHTHSNFMYRIGKTMVYCNPRGYHSHEYNGIFNPTFNFEV